MAEAINSGGCGVGSIIRNEEVGGIISNVSIMSVVIVWSCQCFHLNEVKITEVSGPWLTLLPYSYYLC